MAKVEVSRQEQGGRGTPAPRQAQGNPLLALREQMDRLFDDFTTGWRWPSLSRDLADPFGGQMWSRGMVDVRFDVSESEDAIEIEAELPGIDEDAVELTLSDGVLTLRGEKKAETETKEKDYYLSERRYGSFARSLRLPETVDESKIKATFDRGVLKITLPKRAEARAKRKKIAISKS